MKKILILLFLSLALAGPVGATDPVVAVDTFATYQAGLKDPASHAFAISKSDTDDMAYVTRKIWVGGTAGANGDICLITLGGETVTLKAVPVGTLLEIRATRVKSTGTDAGLVLIGLY